MIYPSPFRFITERTFLFFYRIINISPYFHSYILLNNRTIFLLRRMFKVVMNMRVYIVVILQFFIWSSFTLIEWLSKHDQLIYKVLMFFVFFYIAFLLGNSVTKSKEKTFFITSLSLVIYTSIHYTLSLLTH